MKTSQQAGPVPQVQAAPEVLTERQPDNSEVLQSPVYERGQGPADVRGHSINSTAVLDLASALCDGMPADAMDKAIEVVLGSEEGSEAALGGFDQSDAYQEMAGWDWGAVVQNGAAQTRPGGDGTKDLIEFMLLGRLPTEVTVDVTTSVLDTQPLQKATVMQTMGESNQRTAGTSLSQKLTAGLTGQSGAEGQRSGGQLGFEQSAGATAGQSTTRSRGSQMSLEGTLFRSRVKVELQVRRHLAGVEVDQAEDVLEDVGHIDHWEVDRGL